MCWADEPWWDTWYKFGIFPGYKYHECLRNHDVSGETGECNGPDVKAITQLEKAHIQILVLLITKEATAGGWRG